jgi:hypothetical protein
MHDPEEAKEECAPGRPDQPDLEAVSETGPLQACQQVMEEAAALARAH